MGKPCIIQDIDNTCIDFPSETTYNLKSDRLKTFPEKEI